MKITKEAIVGSVESNDILIKVSSGTGLTINLKSSVLNQYEKEIKAAMQEILDEYKITDITIDAEDKGALDFTIKARLTTALNRVLAE